MKALKITGGVLIVILALLMAFLGVWFLWPWNRVFFANAESEFSIPGLDTSFVPQGFTKIDGRNKYIVSGYMSDGSASRYYVVDSESGDVDKYFTLSVGEDDYDGHACGVASNGTDMWTCSNDGEGGTVYRFSLDDVETVGNGESVDVVDSFKSNNGADSVLVHDGILWVGEFYRNGNYETPAEHRLETRSGETNMALSLGFELQPGADYGLVDAVPDKALSTMGLVQGIAISADGHIVLSTSYSLPDSTIYCYAPVLNEEKHDTITLNDVEIDLWYLDGESLVNEVNAPAMTEEIVIEDGRLYILNESACKKYKFLNRKRIRDVYSLDMEFVIGDNN